MIIFCMLTVFIQEAILEEKNYRLTVALNFSRKNCLIFFNIYRLNKVCFYNS